MNLYFSKGVLQADYIDRREVKYTNPFFLLSSPIRSQAFEARTVEAFNMDATYTR